MVNATMVSAQEPMTIQRSLDVLVWVQRGAVIIIEGFKIRPDLKLESNFTSSDSHISPLWLVISKTDFPEFGLCNQSRKVLMDFTG